MVDLNLWRLQYDDTVLEFGTHESGHPFTRQVIVGAAGVNTDDADHPLSGGMVFGRDLSRGRSLSFAGTHLSTIPQPAARRWEGRMDDAAVFEQAWRARRLRERVGAVATLANVDRGRLVYGRPRPYVPDHAKVRQGWLTYETTFDTADDRFYSTTEKVTTLGVDASPVTAMTFPMTFPFTGAEATVTRTWLDNAGTDDAWPVVTFHRGGSPRLELLNQAGGVEWSLAVAGELAYDEYLTVDTRPWSRAVVLNGTAAPGRIRGTALGAASIPPGTWEARLVAEDPSGLADVTIRWRDAFGTL